MITFIPLLFCALLNGSGCLGKAAKYVAEVYFVVEPHVVRNYLKLGYNKGNVKSVIKGDIDYLVYETNEYYKGMAKKGLDLELRMKKLDIMTEELFDDSQLVKKDQIQSDTALETFQKWLKTNKIHKKHKYDVAVVWTGYNIFGSPGSDEDVGYASYQMACEPDDAIGIVEFDGTQLTASTTAHEIAHILGSDHDKTKKCDDGYVMSPEDSTDGNQWEFSKCSISEISSYIKDLNSWGTNCMNKANTATLASRFKISSQLGRDILDPHKICMRDEISKTTYMCLIAELYDDNIPKGDVVCGKIFCGTAGLQCWEVTPSDGMVCNVGKRCDKGKCVTPPSDFSAPKNVMKDCIFGDSVVTSYEGPPEKCDDFVRTYGDRMCYDKDVLDECCATCAAEKGKTKGCEYGDRDADCSEYDPDEICEDYADECCFTCRNWKGKAKRADDLLSLLKPKVTLPKQPKLKKRKRRMPIVTKMKKARTCTLA